MRLNEIEYNGADTIMDTSCIHNGQNSSLVFCSFVDTSSNEIKYVFLEYRRNTFSKVGNDISNNDMNDYKYGSLLHYSDSILL